MKPDPSLLKKTTDIKQLLNIYEERAKGELSLHTLDNRRKAVNRFIAKMNVCNVTKINYDCLTKFKNALLDDELLEVSINGYLSSLSSFLQYLDIRIEVPYVNNQRGPEARIMKSLLAQDETTRLLEVIPSIKYKAAVGLLMDVGIRVGNKSEKKGYPRRGLLGLNWGDIDFEKGAITIIGKGGATFVRPLGILSEKYLRELKESGNEGKIGPSDPVFVSNRGTRLSYIAFHLTLKRYMKQANIPEEKRHAHAFRHTFGTAVTRKYGIRVAKGALCHENLASTLRYEHICDEEYLKEIFRPDKVTKTNGEGVKMKQCPKCGAELTPDKKLCMCGYDFTLHRCPKCGNGIEENAKFCPYCGFMVGIPKPECICGHELKMDFKVCPNCGRPTDEVKKLWDEDSLKKWSNPRINIGLSEIEKDIPPSELNREKSKRNNQDLNQNFWTEDFETKDCDCKRYQVQVVSSKEQLIRLMEDGWELVKETSTGEFILRKADTSPGNF